MGPHQNLKCAFSKRKKINKGVCTKNTKEFGLFGRTLLGQHAIYA